MDQSGRLQRPRTALCAVLLQRHGPQLVSNPLAGLAMPDASEIRRKRRALTEDELARLLDAAARRPLLDAMTIRLGKRAGQAVAKLTDEPASLLSGSERNGH